MSMHTVTEEGYGVSFEHVELDFNKFHNFVKKYCSEPWQISVEEFDSEFDPDPYNAGEDYTGYFEELFESICQEECGPAEVLCDAIENTHGIHMYCTFDEDGDDYCLLTPAYPWDIKRMEITDLTREKLDEILNTMVLAMAADKPDGKYIGFFESCRCV